VLDRRHLVASILAVLTACAGSREHPPRAPSESESAERTWSVPACRARECTCDFPGGVRLERIRGRSNDDGRGHHVQLLWSDGSAAHALIGTVGIHVPAEFAPTAVCVLHAVDTLEIGVAGVDDQGSSIVEVWTIVPPTQRELQSIELGRAALTPSHAVKRERVYFAASGPDGPIECISSPLRRGGAVRFQTWRLTPHAGDTRGWTYAFDSFEDGAFRRVGTSSSYDPAVFTPFVPRVDGGSAATALGFQRAFDDDPLTNWTPILFLAVDEDGDGRLDRLTL
jgi:hypothetical protein